MTEREPLTPTNSSAGLISHDSAAALLGISHHEVYTLSPQLHRLVTPGRDAVYAHAYIRLLDDYRRERGADTYHTVVEDLARLTTAQTVMQEAESKFEAEVTRIGGDYGSLRIPQLSELICAKKDAIWNWVIDDKLAAQQRGWKSPYHISISEIRDKFRWELPKVLDGQHTFRDEQENKPEPVETQTWVAQAARRAALGDLSLKDVAPHLEKSGYVINALDLSRKAFENLLPLLHRLQTPSSRLFPVKYVDQLAAFLRSDESQGLSRLSGAMAFAGLDSTIELIGETENNFEKGLILLANDHGLISFADLCQLIPVSRATITRWKQDKDQMQENRIAVRSDPSRPVGIEHLTDIESVLSACIWELPEGLERPEPAH